MREGCGRRVWEKGVREGCERRVWEEGVGGGCERREEGYTIKLATNYKRFGGGGGHLLSNLISTCTKMIC